MPKDLSHIKIFSILVILCTHWTAAAWGWLLIFNTNSKMICRTDTPLLLVEWCFCPSTARENNIAEPKASKYPSSSFHFSLFSCCFVAWKRGLPWKFACCFVLVNSVLLNLSCVWISVSLNHYNVFMRMKQKWTASLEDLVDCTVDLVDCTVVLVDCTALLSGLLQIWKDHSLWPAQWGLAGVSKRDGSLTVIVILL